MKTILIRHGEPDYKLCDERGFIGHGRDLAPLSEKGKKQAEEVAEDPILKDAELIVASPYTRALQTAAIISRKIGIKLEVEVDLHEWLPDKTYQFRTAAESMDSYREFNQNNGVYPEGEEKKWETVLEMEKRLFPVLDKYDALGYQKIIFVVHAEVMRRIMDQKNIKCCKSYEYDYLSLNLS